MSRIRWTKELCRQEALKYSSITEWQKNNHSSYCAAWRNKWLKEVSSHMIAKQRPPYTLEEIIEDSKKYSSRTEWARSSTAYWAAQKKGILKEVCAHMDYVAYPWSKEEILEEAKKYKRRAEWAKKSRNTYYSALAHGWLNEASSHMKKTGGISDKEIFFKLKIKEVFPDAVSKMFVNKDPRFPVKRYSLDVYIPSIGKGLEFDGTYWHSFKGMRKSRGRKRLTDQQILDYHKDKDLFFKEMEIQVLHVKEKEWDTSRAECVAQIVDFLGKEVCFDLPAL